MSSLGYKVAGFLSFCAPDKTQEQLDLERPCLHTVVIYGAIEVINMRSDFIGDCDGALDVGRALGDVDVEEPYTSAAAG